MQEPTVTRYFFGNMYQFHLRVQSLMNISNHCLVGNKKRVVKVVPAERTPDIALLCGEAFPQRKVYILRVAVVFR
jgi:hypothetical protein